MAEQIIKKAGALINSGKLKEALELIENAIRVNPYHAPGWELQGGCWMLLADLRKRERVIRGQRS